MITHIPARTLDSLKESPGTAYISSNKQLAVMYREKTGQFAVMVGNFRGPQRNVELEIKRQIKAYIKAHEHGIGSIKDRQITSVEQLEDSPEEEPETDDVIQP